MHYPNFKIKQKDTWGEMGLTCDKDFFVKTKTFALCLGFSVHPLVLIMSQSLYRRKGDELSSGILGWATDYTIQLNCAFYWASSSQKGDQDGSVYTIQRSTFLLFYYSLL